ncbi:MAG: hypothetical protein JSS14_15390 [Proteobacteria bacterium]|nr:hypothetical protein [Pseudomonadota bacterium]
MILIHSSSTNRTQRSPIILVAMGIACFVAGLAFSAEPAHKYNGTYYGKRSLTKGKPSAMCPPEDDVSITIEGNVLTFTTSALEKYVDPFYPRPDGSFGQIFVDAPGGAATVEYYGHIVGDVIEADVTNRLTIPPCEYRWRLKKGP